MSRGRRAARAALGAALALGALVAAPATPAVSGPARSVATAQATNRVAVVVDTGKEVRKVCLRFSEGSISGAEALRRAGVDPVFASFSGMGAGVCSLCGVGCPSGECFCDRTKYWAYHRAGRGAAAWSYARAGASSTAVSDGDVEGWAWGSGVAPAFVTFAEVCEDVVPPAPPAPASPSPPPQAPGTEGPAPAPEPTRPGPALPPSTTVGPVAGPAPGTEGPLPSVPARETATGPVDPIGEAATPIVPGVEAGGDGITVPVPPLPGAGGAGAADPSAEVGTGGVAARAAGQENGGGSMAGVAAVGSVIALLGAVAVRSRRSRRHSQA